jgi:hypothetical protein
MAIIDRKAVVGRLRRLAWFVAIWAMSVAALGVFGLGVRLVLKG